MTSTDAVKSNRIKAVIDTSVILSAHLNSSSQSSPRKLWQAILDDKFIPVVSPQIEREIILVCIRKNFSEEKIDSIVRTLAEKSNYIRGEYTTNLLDAIDPNDNIILAAAYESKADYIVSLDKESLLPLKYFHGTQILSPSLFIRQLEDNQKKFKPYVLTSPPKLTSVFLDTPDW
jgi:putative PIN family toxin of toxin-antitoxin system